MSGSIAGLTVERIETVLLECARELSAELTATAADGGGRNPSGDRRVAADVLADDLLVDRLASVGGVGEVASEEREDVVDAGQGLSVALDPLDGSKNLATNNPVGTILGVYDAPLPARGRDLVAAAVVLYGPTTTAMVARRGRVIRYEVGEDERRTLETDLELPDDPSVYGLGGGDDDWPAPVRTVAAELREELTLRYSGAVVADVAQVLARGGLFGYPQLQSSPQGKLRHQYEANPLAYIVETAGGASTDGARSLLDRPPAGLHASVPTYVGNEALVERVEDRLSAALESSSELPSTSR